MLETAGTKLRRARTQRQLSLEDAARATKIRASQLADLERDDYSNFANLAYARGFLVGYGKYLRTDVRPYMDAFADASTFGLDDYQYLSEMPLGEYRAPTRPWRKRRKGSARQFMGLAAGIVALAVGVFSFYLYVNYKRLGGNLGTLADRQSAQVQGETRNGETTAGEAAKPGMVPVAATPGPPMPVPPVAIPAAPQTVPIDDENRTAAAALASADQSHSLAMRLTSLAMPAVQPPGAANAALPPTTLGKDGARLAHAMDVSADAFRADAAKPQKVSNDSRH